MRTCQTLQPAGPHPIQLHHHQLQTLLTSSAAAERSCWTVCDARTSAGCRAARAAAALHWQLRRPCVSAHPAGSGQADIAIILQNAALIAWCTVLIACVFDTCMACGKYGQALTTQHERYILMCLHSYIEALRNSAIWQHSFTVFLICTLSQKHMVYTAKSEL